MKSREEIENPMISALRGKYAGIYMIPKPTCDCGSYAKIKVNGNPRCWECAEDEGVERYE